MRELRTEDDIGFCCFCPNGAFCTFYYYFGQMVRFAPFFFFFEFRIELAGWRRYRWLRPIRTNLALIGADRPDFTRVDASRETKKKKAGRSTDAQAEVSLVCRTQVRWAFCCVRASQIESRN